MKKAGYRLATPDERVKLNERGTCWVVRDYGDVSRACPNPRREGQATCEWHVKDEGKLETKLDDAEVAA